MPEAPEKEKWDISDHYKVAPGDVAKILYNISEEVRNADFSGMTDVDVYNWIENKYIDAFGEDFMMAHSLRVLDNALGTWNYSLIGTSFQMTVGGQFGGDASLNINRQRQYGDLSVREVQDAIRAKYPKKMTNRELFLMLSEMEAVGVDCNVAAKSSYIAATVTPISDRISGKDTMLTGTEYQKRWKDALDNPANLSILFGSYNIAEKSASGNKMGPEVKELLMRLFGGIDRGDGLFVSSYYDEYYQWQMSDDGRADSHTANTQPPDLLDSFLEMLEKHDKTLEEIRDRRIGRNGGWAQDYEKKQIYESEMRKV
jgi:hypothetical protein